MATYTHATRNSRNPAAASTAPNELEQNLLRLILITGIAYLVWGEKLNISFSFGDPETSAAEQARSPRTEATASIASFPAERAKKERRKIGIELPSSALNNVTFCIDPAFARRNDVPAEEVENRNAAVQEYLRRFGPVAVAEMHKFGIPASVTLAQGLVESNAGQSQLARKTNNHFGIKCFSKRCRSGHCVNFTDDSHKDFFVKYANTWGSFRAHSQFLKSSGRYAGLFELGQNDFAGWAHGLARAGYATDKKYGEKLIVLIQNLGLDRFDNE